LKNELTFNCLLDSKISAENISNPFIYVSVTVWYTSVILICLPIGVRHQSCKLSHLPVMSSWVKHFPQIWQHCWMKGV